VRVGLHGAVSADKIFECSQKIQNDLGVQMKVVLGFACQLPTADVGPNEDIER
jgi:hypothetical protein